MEADHPAKRLRRSAATCPRPEERRRLNAALKADHPAKGRASVERSSSTTWPPSAVPSRRRRVGDDCARCST
eukprot:5244489-Prymnesium_polylepis.1